MPLQIITFDPAADAYALWDHVRKHHWYLLAVPTLDGLRTFWMTWTAALRHHGHSLSMGEPDFDHFSPWIAAKRGHPESTGGWWHFLSTEHEAEAGFVAFFTELDEFRTRRLVEIGAAEVAAVRWPARKFTIAADGTEIDEPILPIIAVRLLAYLPEGAVWAELLREGGTTELEWMGGARAAVAWCQDSLHAEVALRTRAGDALTPPS